MELAIENNEKEENSWNVFTTRKENQIDEFKVKAEDSTIQISTTMNSQRYELTKNFNSGEIYLSRNGSQFLLNEESVEVLNGNSEDAYPLTRLLALLIEIDEPDLPPTTPPAQTNGIRTIHFVSVGLNRTTSEARARMQAQNYIADLYQGPNVSSNCVILGTDTDCATENHFCITTVTVICPY